MQIKDVKFKVVGVTFNNENGTSRQKLIAQMDTNSPVVLRREPANRFDKNAVAVDFIDQQIGYIPGQYAQIIGPMMDQGRKFEAKVDGAGTYEGTSYCHILVSEV